ncbi:MAG: nucleoside hydrolase [Acidimicrobiia bacterium]|nr:nucleoside hydrolase [Acidimicrobiia bacterium]
MKVHFDTDLGTDMDDLAALVMLLGAADVELTGITTSIDPGGRRAGYVGHVLGLANRRDVPVAAGAEVSLTTRTTPGGFPPDDRRWPEPVSPVPGPVGSALGLLADSIGAGATIVVVGPSTNLGLLGVERPGLLAQAEVVMMGGWFDLPAVDLPPWGPDRDWNVQCDTGAAVTLVGGAAAVTMVPIPLTLRVHLRRVHVDRLRASGPLGRLIAFQAERHGAEETNHEVGRAHPGLPDDLLNFQHDPLTCAAALGWASVSFERRRVTPVLDHEVLRFTDDPHGGPVRVAVGVDADAFTADWLDAVEAADRRA